MIGLIILMVMMSVILGCGHSTENNRKTEIDALLMKYNRMRIDCTSFANSIAEYIYLKSQKSNQYFILSGHLGNQIHEGERFFSKEGISISVVWLPLSESNSQTIIDMCYAYNQKMLHLSRLISEAGDDETAKRISLEISNLCPDIVMHWDQKENTEQSTQSRHAEAVATHRVVYAHSALAEALLGLDGKLRGGELSGIKGTDPIGEQ